MRSGYSMYENGGKSRTMEEMGKTDARMDNEKQKTKKKGLLPNHLESSASPGQTNTQTKLIRIFKNV